MIMAMNALSRIVESPDLSLYRLDSTHSPELEIYCASTPSSRALLNTPETVGVEFTRRLQEAVEGILGQFPNPEERRRFCPEESGVVHFLRSGLNFGIREALYNAWGFNEHLSSFITSQRDRDQYGRWFIRDDAYRKIELPRNATLFIGEIVATGVTMKNGLQIIGRMAKNLGRPVRNLVFFTVGCHKIEKALSEFDALMRASFRGYHTTYLFYLEGKFHLADSKTEARLKVQGTDLMRFPALLAPEFEQSQFLSETAPLERCVIYDGGARAFNPQEHFAELSAYWEEVVSLGVRGTTLEEAYRERWPAEEYRLPQAEYLKRKREVWAGVDEKRLLAVYETAGAWLRRLRERSGAGSLVELARRRLRRISSGRSD